MKYDYHIETFAIGKWLNIVMGSREYCRGYLNARQDFSPRPAYRLMRSDGAIVDQYPARDDVSVGMIAGFPTAEQYELAAKRALDMAAAIRERKEKEEQRRNRAPQQSTPSA